MKLISRWTSLIVISGLATIWSPAEEKSAELTRAQVLQSVLTATQSKDPTAIAASTRAARVWIAGAPPAEHARQLTRHERLDFCLRILDAIDANVDPNYDPKQRFAIGGGGPGVPPEKIEANRRIAENARLQIATRRTREEWIEYARQEILQRFGRSATDVDEVIGLIEANLKNPSLREALLQAIEIKPRNAGE